MLKVDLIRGPELTRELALQWEGLRARNDRLYSPFYSSDFTKIVSAIGRDVEIAIVHEDSEPVAFFPFERKGKSLAIPVGGKMNDAHGVIAPSEFEFDFAWLLRQCKVQRWDFHAMFWPSSVGSRSSFATVKSFMAKLEVGPQPYRQQLEERNYTIEAHRRKSRKFKKDHPGAYLDLDCRDTALLDRLIELKRGQYQRTHIFDIFSVPWTRDLVRHFVGYEGHSVRGCLSVLRADGERIVAIHFGLREGDLLHYWFPVYETSFHQYSPGTELFLRIADAAPEHGIRRIDMGYGEQAYKEKLVNTVDEAYEGCVSTTCWAWHFRRCQHRLREQLKNVVLKDRLKRGLRSVWPSFGKSQFQ